VVDLYSEWHDSIYNIKSSRVLYALEVMPVSQSRACH